MRKYLEISQTIYFYLYYRHLAVLLLKSFKNILLIFSQAIPARHHLNYLKMVRRGSLIL